jgi:hypothetical protein
MRYWVSEKSDGIRAFMLLHSESIFFVDRRFDFYRLEDPNFIIPDPQNPEAMQHQVLNLISNVRVSFLFIRKIWSFSCSFVEIRFFGLKY